MVSDKLGYSPSSADGTWVNGECQLGACESYLRKHGSCQYRIRITIGEWPKYYLNFDRKGPIFISACTTLVHLDRLASGGL